MTNVVPDLDRHLWFCRCRVERGGCYMFKNGRSHSTLMEFVNLHRFHYAQVISTRAIWYWISMKYRVSKYFNFYRLVPTSAINIFNTRLRRLLGTLLMFLSKNCSKLWILNLALVIICNTRNRWAKSKRPKLNASIRCESSVTFYETRCSLL